MWQCQLLKQKSFMVLVPEYCHVVGDGGCGLGHDFGCHMLATLHGPAHADLVAGVPLSPGLE